MILVIIMVLSIATFLFLYLKAEKDYYRIYKNPSSNWQKEREAEAYRDTWKGIFFFMLGAFIIFTVMTTLTVATKPSRYIEMVETKQSLEARLDVYLNSDKEIDFKDVEWQRLYKDIAELNITINKHAYWVKNPFINWYYSKRIAEIEPVKYS